MVVIYYYYYHIVRIITILVKSYSSWGFVCLLSHICVQFETYLCFWWTFRYFYQFWTIIFFTFLYLYLQLTVMSIKLVFFTFPCLSEFPPFWTFTCIQIHSNNWLFMLVFYRHIFAAPKVMDRNCPKCQCCPKPHQKGQALLGEVGWVRCNWRPVHEALQDLNPGG